MLSHSHIASLASIVLIASTGGVADRDQPGALNVEAKNTASTFEMAVSWVTSGMQGPARSGKAPGRVLTPPLPPPPVCPSDVPIDELPGVCFELTVPNIVETETDDPAVVEDFISYTPSPAVVSSQPDGLALRGVPANFIAAASTHIRSGELLGRPASAEFTPIGYAWDFGDGSRLVTGTPGATWDALGQDDFTTTPTSHTFAERGTYAVTLVTYYTVRASYSDAGTWFAVPGVLPVASDPFSVQVVTVRPVLVSRDCIQNPTGVGCPQ